MIWIQRHCFRISEVGLIVERALDEQRKSEQKKSNQA